MANGFVVGMPHIYGYFNNVLFEINECPLEYIQTFICLMSVIYLIYWLLRYRNISGSKPYLFVIHKYLKTI